MNRFPTYNFQHLHFESSSLSWRVYALHECFWGVMTAKTVLPFWNNAIMVCALIPANFRSLIFTYLAGNIAMSFI